MVGSADQAIEPDLHLVPVDTGIPAHCGHYRLDSCGRYDDKLRLVSGAHEACDNEGSGFRCVPAAMI